MVQKFAILYCIIMRKWLAEIVTDSIRAPFRNKRSLPVLPLMHQRLGEMGHVIAPQMNEIDPVIHDDIYPSTSGELLCSSGARQRT